MALIAWACETGKNQAQEICTTIHCVLNGTRDEQIKNEKRVKAKIQKNWWLFYATDFQTLMYPCFIFCRNFGLFPYKINNSIFEVSKPHYFLSITIICAICVFNLISGFNIFVTKNNFDVLLTFLQFIWTHILITSLAIATLVSSNSRMRFFQNIMEISSKLSPETYQKLSRLIHAKDIIGSFFIISMGSKYIYEKLSDALDRIFSIYGGLMMFQLDMMYINCVCILKACFEEINNNLLHMQKLMVNNEPSVLPMFSYKQRNPFLIKLKALKKQHITISNTLHMLNMTFGLQLLLSIIANFLGITLGIYFHMVKWHNGLVIILEQGFLCGAVCQIIRMALIVWVCETGKNQAQEICTTIHCVLNDTRDEQIKNELQLFSLQILHCENTFSVKALSIDAKLFTTMIGTITTYILIVLQFLIMSHSCDEKTAIMITQSN